jgi:acetylornithine deacetylase/succinyl-diaminopimelate desuccinylase-like protein
MIETLARESVAVLVLEPALPGGAVKTARKGVGEFEVVTHGVSAHAGVDPAAGASAIRELMRQIAVIDGWNDPPRGLTVNVGVVEGGTRSNVGPSGRGRWRRVENGGRPPSRLRSADCVVDAESDRRSRRSQSSAPGTDRGHRPVRSGQEVARSRV